MEETKGKLGVFGPQGGFSCVSGFRVYGWRFRV